MATDATPDKVELMMDSAGYRTLPTGKAFGVINVFTDDDEYEIATFRKDSYDEQDISNANMLDLLSFININNLKSSEFSDWYNNRFLKWEKGEIPEFDNWGDMAKKDIPSIMKRFAAGSGRRPDAVEFTTIDQDVKRRDLTINALFYDIDSGEIVDLVGGVDDFNASPNPFVSQTLIDFNIDNISDVSVEIYDIRGVLIRILVKNKENGVLWDGKMSNGENAPTGAYFCRLISNNIHSNEIIKIIKY